jgi:hypothetical protein
LTVDDMQLQLEANIALQINPVEIILPLPWATVPPVVEPIEEVVVEPIEESPAES